MPTEYQLKVANTAFHALTFVTLAMILFRLGSRPLTIGELRSAPPTALPALLERLPLVRVHSGNLEVEGTVTVDGSVSIDGPVETY